MFIFVYGVNYKNYYNESVIFNVFCMINVSVFLLKILDEVFKVENAFLIIIYSYIND